MDKECLKCGRIYFYTRSNRKGSTATYCSRCYATETKSKLKAKAVDYKGGCCVLCGYNRHNVALDFHHLDKSIKTYSISNKIRSRSWEEIKRELDKCVLLCANCHREVENNLVILSAINSIG